MARVEQLVGKLPGIVSEMSSLINSRQTAEEAQANWGWRHGGPNFTDEMTKLKMELKAQGKPVSSRSFLFSVLSPDADIGHHVHRVSRLQGVQGQKSHRPHDFDSHRWDHYVQKGWTGTRPGQLLLHWRRKDPAWPGYGCDSGRSREEKIAALWKRHFGYACQTILMSIFNPLASVCDFNEAL